LIENENHTVGIESERVASLPVRGLEKPAVGSGSFELGQELAGISLFSSSPCTSIGKDGELTGQDKARVGERAKPPPSYVCPIGMDLMVDPVILATGHTYDRSSIERWIDQGNKTCPVTGMKLRHTEMTPNFALRSAIHEWAAEHGVPLPTEVKTKAQSSKVISTHRDSEDGGEDGGTVMSGDDEIVWALEKKGNSLVTASADSTVRIWDISSKRCTHVLEDHRRPVLSLASTDDYIFSGSYDYTVRVWDWATQRRVATLRGHTDAVRALVVV
jgi:F-box/WD-40 domain protein 7